MVIEIDQEQNSFTFEKWQRVSMRNVSLKLDFDFELDIRLFATKMSYRDTLGNRDRSGAESFYA